MFWDAVQFAVSSLPRSVQITIVKTHPSLLFLFRIKLIVHSWICYPLTQLQKQTTNQNACLKTVFFNEEWIFITLKGKACMKLNHYISDWVLKLQFFEISRTRLVFSFKSIQMNENIHEFIFPSELNLTIFFFIPIACCSTLNFRWM